VGFSESILRRRISFRSNFSRRDICLQDLQASFGNITDIPNAPVPIKRQEFLPDTQEIGNGVNRIMGNWQQQLEANNRLSTLEFVQRARFTAAFPTTMTPAQFVDKLFQMRG